MKTLEKNSEKAGIKENIIAQHETLNKPNSALAHMLMDFILFYTFHNIMHPI